MKDTNFYVGFVLDEHNNIMYSHVHSHKLIAQVDSIVNMIGIGRDENLRHHVSAYVFDTNENKVVLGYTTKSVDEYLVEIESEKYPDITQRELALDMLARLFLEDSDDEDDDEDGDNDDHRLGPTVNIFTA